jgi:hypothetical protein
MRAFIQTNLPQLSRDGGARRSNRQTRVVN